MARLVWVVVVLLTAGIFIASPPAHFEALRTVCPAEPCVAGQPSPEGARVLDGLGLTLGVNAAYRLALDFVVALGFCAVGVTLFWQKPRDGGVLFVSFALVLFGLTWPDAFDSAVVHPVWGEPAGFLSQLGLASLFVFFFVFPDGRFVPRWTRWLRRETDLDALSEDLLSAVAKTMRPTHASLWLRASPGRGAEL